MEYRVTDISKERSNDEPYSVTNAVEDERHRRQVDDQDRRISENRRLKKSKFAYNSDQAKMFEVIEPVKDLLRNGDDYLSYSLIE